MDDMNRPMTRERLRGNKKAFYFEVAKDAIARARAEEREALLYPNDPDWQALKRRQAEKARDDAEFYLFRRRYYL